MKSNTWMCVMIVSIALVLITMSIAKKHTNQKQIVTVNISQVTEAFINLLSRTELDESESTLLIERFSTLLEEGVNELSHDYIVLSKSAVISIEQDKTAFLESYISHGLTSGAQ